MKFRNVILSQFPSDTNTDLFNLSCVCNQTSQKIDIRHHKHLEHAEQDGDPPTTDKVTKAPISLHVVPHQVRLTLESPAASNTPVKSNTSVVPLQVLAQQEGFVNSNATVNTIQANLTSVVSPKVSPRHAKPANSISTVFTSPTVTASVELLVSIWSTSTDIAITTHLTDDFCRQWSLPDQRRIWEIAWYVSMC